MKTFLFRLSYYLFISALVAFAILDIRDFITTGSLWGLIGASFLITSALMNILVMNEI